jgi:hypothetical protein
MTDGDSHQEEISQVDTDDATTAPRSNIDVEMQSDISDDSIASEEQEEQSDGDSHQEEMSQVDTDDATTALRSNIDFETQSDTSDDSSASEEQEEQSDDDITPRPQSPSSPTPSSSTDDSEVNRDGESDRLRDWQISDDAVPWTSIESHLPEKTSELTNGYDDPGCQSIEDEEKKRRVQDGSVED